MTTHRPYRRIIVWFRRALRVDDNMALWNALDDAESIVPLLSLSEAPAYRERTERRTFIRAMIQELDIQLRKRGTALHVRMGDPVRAIPAAAAAYGADAVYAVALHDAPGQIRDAALKKKLAGMGVTLVFWPDRVLRDAREVLNGAAEPYRVFTPYKRAWLVGADDVPRPVTIPRRIDPVRMAEGSQPLHALAWNTPDEQRHAANPMHLLRTFLRNAVAQYDTQRNLPGVQGTSRLSPHLAIGSISIRRVYWESRAAQEDGAASARKSVHTFIGELVWREFYYQILSNFPHVLKTAFREEFRGLQWSENKRLFDRWKEGTTGFPIVDAAMRQLQQEGWMHNRARMIVASFLTKDLHLSWQWGERHFMDHLTDADLASNNGGWQWTAGTGTDASPWFRIFNPVLQAKKFDPDGVYVRRYVPELRSAPTHAIHEPSTMNRQEQEAAGCILGRSYPLPIVDHCKARLRTLSLYKHHA